MLKVGVIGAHGRMGAEVCRVVDEADDLELVCRIDRNDSLDLLTDAGAEVVVEFSEPSSVKDNTLFCVEHGIHAVVGATGLKPDDIEDLKRAAGAAGANVFIAPNFALGAVLMMRFAAEAARHYERAEIIERHHEKKLDAPSGTALRTADMMAEERAGSGAPAGDIPIHSVRLPGSVAHQEVIFGGPGESLTIKHDSLDRASFMPGVLLAVRRIGSLPGVTVGLEHLLD